MNKFDLKNYLMQNNNCLWCTINTSTPTYNSISSFIIYSKFLPKFKKVNNELFDDISSLTNISFPNTFNNNISFFSKFDLNLFIYTLNMIELFNWIKKELNNNDFFQEYLFNFYIKFFSILNDIEIKVDLFLPKEISKKYNEINAISLIKIHSIQNITKFMPQNNLEKNAIIIFFNEKLLKYSFC